MLGLVANGSYICNDAITCMESVHSVQKSFKKLQIYIYLKLIFEEQMPLSAAKVLPFCWLYRAVHTTNFLVYRSFYLHSL